MTNPFKGDSIKNLLPKYKGVFYNSKKGVVKVALKKLHIMLNTKSFFGMCKSQMFGNKNACQSLTFTVIALSTIGVFVPSFAQVLPSIEIQVLEKGTLVSYFEQKSKMRQDISGAAFGPGGLLIVDDGGENAEFPSIRTLNPNKVSEPSATLPLGRFYRDMEAVAWMGDRYLITTSMSLVGEDHPSYRLLGEVFYEEKKRTFRQGRMTDYREVIIKALSKVTNDSLWFTRTISTFAKYGGVNVEGLASVPNNNDAVIFGLRSPLVNPRFGNPAIDKKLTLDSGKTILVKVIAPFSDEPLTEPMLLDLEGQGVRSLEYISSINAYIIIAGSTHSDKGRFQLWLWSMENSSIQKVHLPELDELCRPESIVALPSKSGVDILILSENSGDACTGSKIQYIKFNLKRGLQ